MTRELLDPPALHPAPGFSHPAVPDGARVVHFAGQLSLTPDVSLVADDLYGQTAGVRRNVQIAMEAVGAGWGDVVRRTVCTLRPTEHETITAAIDAATGGADHPAQTIAGVAGPAVHGCLIDECTAVVGVD